MAPVILKATSPIVSLTTNIHFCSSDGLVYSLNTKATKRLKNNVIAGYKELNAKGVEQRIASLMIPPPRAVSADAISIPKMSSLFFMATRKPLMLKAVIPMISAKIKNSGIYLVLVLIFKAYIS